MKVILLKEIPKLGKPGEVKQVADGYARNFLIPFGYAEPATEPAMKNIARRQTEISSRLAREQAAFQGLAEKLRQTPLRFALKLGKRGQAFGSITAQDIAEKLAEQGITIERDWVELAQGIKATGEHTVVLKLPHGVSGELKIAVEAEDSTQQVKRVK